ncbi:penicillin-binding protein 2, partial [Magnetococcales bacterium HHB-1]
GSLKDVLFNLQDYLGLDNKEIQMILKQAKRQRSFLPIKVKSHLEWPVVSRLESRIYRFPGTMIQVQSLRHYPYAGLAAHVLGYLGEVSKKDKIYFSNNRFRPGDLVGKTGMERLYEPILRGIEGVREVESNAVGRQVRELHRTPPKPGKDLYLTLDIALQKEAEEALGGKAGAVVGLDPRNGEILLMANTPAYDPNQFIRGFGPGEWKKLINDPLRPLSNKAIQGQYPPGSTFKVVVALTALKYGIISPKEKLFCGGHLMRHKHRFHCWQRHGHGYVDMVTALERSCDVYFYRLAEKMGIDLIAREAERFGLGQFLDVGLEGEKSGLIPNRAWKRITRNAAWYPGETLIAAIGQGFVLATPLQMASMISVVANGGTLYQPTLVRQDGYAPHPRVRRRSFILPDHLAVIRRGLEQVYYGVQGTARRAQPEMVRAAGKTGTSQVASHKRSRSGAIIRSKNARLQDHALFVAYAPVDAPEIALSVIVEHGGHGGAAAAPVAKRIFDYLFHRS